MSAELLAATAGAAGALALLFWVRYLRSRRILRQRLLAVASRPSAALPALWVDRHASLPPLRPLAPLRSATRRPRRPAVALALALVAVLTAAQAAAALTGLSPLPLLPACAAAAIYGARRLRRHLRQRDAAAAEAQLVEACRLLSGALRAGLSVPQGVAVLAAQLPAPAGGHFRRLAGELALGVSLETALAEFHQRLPSRSLRLFGLALSLNHRMGGDLAGVLADLGRTLAERQQVQAAIAAATAEPRFVATLLPVMPVAIALLLNALIPGFLRPLFTTWGLLLLAACIALQWFGLLAVRRVTRIIV